MADQAFAVRGRWHEAGLAGRRVGSPGPEPALGVGQRDRDRARATDCRRPKIIEEAGDALGIVASGWRSIRRRCAKGHVHLGLLQRIEYRSGRRIRPCPPRHLSCRCLRRSQRTRTLQGRCRERGLLISARDLMRRIESGCERRLEQALHRLGHDALAPMRLAQPVAELGRLALMIGEPDNADELVVDGDGVRPLVGRCAKISTKAMPSARV